MRKLRVELDADLFTVPIETLGELFGYLEVVCARLSDHGMPLGVHQPATAITDAHGRRVGCWHVTDGLQTDGTEPGNGLARLEAEREARANA